MDLGWVDLDLGSSYGCWAAYFQCMMLNIPNLSSTNPNPGTTDPSTPCTKLYHDVPPSSLSALQRDPSSLAFSIGDWIDGLVACVVDVHCLRSDIVRGRGNNTKETVGHHHAPSGILIEGFHHFTTTVTAGTGSDTPFHEGEWRQAEGKGSSNVREALKNCMKAAEWGFLHYPKKT